MRKPHPPSKLTATYLGQFHSQLSYTRMPHGHAALCLMCGHILEQKMPVIRTGKRARKTVVVAYADDITIFVTTPTDVPVINDDTILRKSHGSSPEHTEMEGTGGGRMEYIHGYAKHIISR